MTDEITAYCSFCGYPNTEVVCIVKGPGGVGICNECVKVAVETVADYLAKKVADDDKVL
jgi:ATP-dependent protease Clp ATPase subunit